MPEIELVDLLESGRPPFGDTVQALLLDDIQADDTEIADVVADEAGNIVIPHE